MHTYVSIIQSSPYPDLNSDFLGYNTPLPCKVAVKPTANLSHSPFYFCQATAASTTTAVYLASTRNKNVHQAWKTAMLRSVDSHAI